jgi:hypothetical protein
VNRKELGIALALVQGIRADLDARVELAKQQRADQNELLDAIEEDLMSKLED